MTYKERELNMLLSLLKAGGNCSIKLNPLITTCDECPLDGSQKCGQRELTVELIRKKLKRYTQEEIFEALL